MRQCVTAGNGNAAPAAQSKPAANGRSAAAPAQQWQSPQPSPRPPQQDQALHPEAAKMSPEFKVGRYFFIAGRLH